MIHSATPYPPGLHRRQAGKLPYFVFPGLTGQPGIRHGVFTRSGGVSPPPWQSLNLAWGVGDRAEHVRTNRRRLREALGFPLLAAGRQVHGRRVAVIDPRPAADLEVEVCDALVTEVPRVGLMIQQADCQAVLLHDPERPAVGIAHSGWRGSVQNIVAATVEAMVSVFGTEPARLRAAVSPALGPCCAEFTNYRTELPASFWPYQVRPNYFDFWALSRDQLVAAGVKLDNIEIAGLCTVCCPEFFSYRREGRTGRFGSVIGIMP